MKIDAHVHLDLYKKPYEIISSLEDGNIFSLFMTNLPTYFELAEKNMGIRKNIRLSLGFHPGYIERKNIEKELYLFKKNISKTSYIGEIGLDYSKVYIKNKELQLFVFREIANTLQNEKKIISVHSKKSESDVLDILKEFKIKNVIFHWYSGNIGIMNNILNSGYYFSINYDMLMSKKGRSIVSKIPKDRVLTETDGPFASNNTHLDNKIHIDEIIELLAELWGDSPVNVIKIIEKNFMKLINSIK
ncbi:TatD family hydrolase [Clostridium sp. C2-6-12]|uniref:TatD family hydrolase n=1 Tax=Clostridium sp. C2-6-12 TaxID=2698832 RepID=UPI001371AB50|nr:TatD family hydrolase [Clostridium sp. C2-6-12]